MTEALKTARAVEALRASEQRRKVLLNAIPDMMFVMSRAGKFLDFHPAKGIQPIVPPSEFLGATIDQVSPPRFAAVFREHLTRALDSGETQLHEYPLEVDGELRYFEARYAAVGDDEALVLVRCITDRKRAEARLRESEEKWRELVANAPDFVTIYDLDARLQFINRPAEGRRSEELIGSSAYDLLHPDDREIWRACFEWVSKTGEVAECEVRAPAGEEQWAWFRNRFWAVKSRGKITGVTLISTDVTAIKRAQEERERLESQLRQTQKLEAIGVLAAGIAHDFNNLLQSIIGYSELAKSALPEGSEEAETIEEVLKAGRRASDLVRQILAFSRRSDQERKPVEPCTAVREALTLLRASIPSTIEIRQNIGQVCGTILADPSQLHQVVVNLCTNAYQAMGPGGGVLEVDVEGIEVTTMDAGAAPTLLPGSYIRLTVADSGPGINPEIRERIFDPFFTTKPPGKGAGLGLSVVHGIVAGMGGSIAVESKPDCGAVFRVYLPLYAEAPVREAKDERPLQGRGERILVVDDEEAVVEFIRESLDQAGYKVTAVTESPAALRLFEKSPEEYDLILSDVTMPRMTGVELARAVLRSRPQIPVILATGYSELITAEEVKRMGVSRLLIKPFHSDALAAAVRAALDADA